MEPCECKPPRIVIVGVLLLGWPPRERCGDAMPILLIG